MAHHWLTYAVKARRALRQAERCEDPRILLSSLIDMAKEAEREGTQEAFVRALAHINEVEDR